jgi:hypothetical protein
LDIVSLGGDIFCATPTAVLSMKVLVGLKGVHAAGSLLSHVVSKYSAAHVLAATSIEKIITEFNIFRIKISFF